MTEISTKAQVESLREQIASKQSELRAAENMPVSHAELKQSLRRLIDSEHERISKQLAYKLHQIATGSREDVFGIEISGLAAKIDISLAGLFCIVAGGPDNLLSTLAGYIAECPDGLDSAQRVQRVEALSRDLDQLEAEEERLIVQSEMNGEPLRRRANARPEIILGSHVENERTRSPQYMARPMPAGNNRERPGLPTGVRRA